MPDKNRPDAGENAFGDSSLHRAMNATVVAKHLRKIVPLTSTAHLIDDPVERLSLAGARAPGNRGWIELSEDVLNDHPQFVVLFPNRRKWFDLTFLSGNPWLLALGSYGWLSDYRSLLR
jgi:hypothetical protein